MVQPAPSAKYAELSRHYIRQAEEEFQKGDLSQASEKAWGAVASAVKSVAAQRGWTHQHYALLFDVSEQIADELGRPDLGRLFRSAGFLHINFYEDWMAAGNVRGGIDDAQVYIAELRSVLSSQPPAFVPQTVAQAARLRRLTSP